MTTFETASFDGIEFPISRRSVKGGIRHHIHEFPHSPGGDPEKMGRKLYVIQMTAWFHDLPGSDLEQEFPGLYPQGLYNLRSLLESEKTADLVVPGLGTIKAFATDWDQDADFERSLSGEGMQISFLEDQSSAFLLENLFEFAADSLFTANDELQAQARLAAFLAEHELSLFAQLDNLIAGVRGVLGAADAMSRLLEAKLLGVANLCRQIDSDMESLQSPANHRLLEAMKDVWMAANELAGDLLQKKSPILVYTVPAVMSAAQVSMAIYGTAERAVELLQLNPIDDAFAIPAGTNVKYLQAA